MKNRWKYLAGAAVGAFMTLVAWKLGLYHILLDTPKVWRDRAALWSNLATILGFLAAASAIIVAVIDFRFSSQASRAEHMHNLFKDFLHIRIEALEKGGLLSHVVTDDSAGSDKTKKMRDSINREALSFRMYTLEEMWAWLQKERFLASRLFFPSEPRPDYFTG